MCHISHCWGQIGISFWLLEGPNQLRGNAKIEFRGGNSELTWWAQWAPSRTVLAHVCPKWSNMGQIGLKHIGVDLAFRTDLIKRSALARHLEMQDKLLLFIVYKLKLIFFISLNTKVHIITKCS